jgi:hypothetical protein
MHKNPEPLDRRSLSTSQFLAAASRPRRAMNVKSRFQNSARIRLLQCSAEHAYWARPDVRVETSSISMNPSNSPDVTLTTWTTPFYATLLWAAASSTAAILTRTAEDSGMIVSLGEWVLYEALRQVAQWQREQAPSVAVAVNVSPNA